MKQLFLFIIAGVILICKCTAPTAGGTSDTGNARIAAVVYTHDGARAAGASVTLVPSDYLRGIFDDSTTQNNRFLIQTTTDDTGYFTIDSITGGKYCIEINDRDSSAALMNINIRSVPDSTITLSDTLHPYVTVEGNAGSVADSTEKRYVEIYGLNRLIPIATDGSFRVSDLPEGTFTFRIIGLDDSWTPVDIDNVKLSVGATVALPFTGWNYRSEVVLNTSADGADVAANVYNFPLLIRLSENNFDFSKAKSRGDDIRFCKTDGAEMPFEIERWDSLAKSASIWVTVDTVYGNNSDQSLTMLWGNPNSVAHSNSEVVFDTSEGFFGVYHFNDTLTDATAHRFDGVNNLTVDIASGIAGHARLFNGRAHISLGDLPDRPKGTLSFWFRPVITIDSSLQLSQGIWGKKESDSTNFFMIFEGKDFFASSVTSAPGKLITKMEEPDGGFYLETQRSAFIVNTWYYATWTWGANESTLFVNGDVDDTSSVSQIVTGSGADEIGRSYFDSSNLPDTLPRNYTGTLDEFRIDTVVRSKDWIRLCFMNQRVDDKLVVFRR